MRPRACCSTFGWLALPTQAPGRQLAGAQVHHHVDAAGNAIAVSIVRVGQLEDSFHRNRLQESHADDGLGDSRRDHHLGGRRAERRVQNGVNRFAEAVGRTVGIAAGDGLVVDADSALGSHPVDRAILQLVAIDRLRRRTVRPRHAQSQQQAAFRVSVVLGRPGSAVAGVARGTGLRVEGRAKPVTRLGGRRGRDPVLREEAVPRPRTDAAPRWKDCAPTTRRRCRQR